MTSEEKKCHVHELIVQRPSQRIFVLSFCFICFLASVFRVACVDNPVSWSTCWLCLTDFVGTFYEALNSFNFVERLLVLIHVNSIFLSKLSPDLFFMAERKYVRAYWIE